MLLRDWVRWTTLAVACALLAPGAQADSPRLNFGVLSQHSPVVTAEYWNPILQYLGAKSGVPLTLKLGSSGSDTAARVARGEYDVIYSNHNFKPGNDAAGYRVIARPAEAGIQGQIVVREDSPIKSLADLAGKDVAFPHNQAFVAYFVTLDALLREHVQVKEIFAGTQDSALVQLKSGRVAAASVNSQVLRDYAERENFRYRVLWSSDTFLNIPIAVHPRVSDKQARALQAALLGMADDPEGAQVLAASAALIKQRGRLGFVKAADGDYENVRRVYRNSRAAID